MEFVCLKIDFFSTFITLGRIKNKLWCLSKLDRQRPDPCVRQTRRQRTVEEVLTGQIRSDELHTSQRPKQGSNESKNDSGNVQIYKKEHPEMR